MKVQRLWTAWYDHCWLLLAACSCMLMQKQQCTLAAAVDSEIFKARTSTSTSSSSFSSNSIDRHAWPPMKNHDIWSDVSAYANDDESFNEQRFEEAEEVFKTIGQDNFEFVANSFDKTVNAGDDNAKSRDTEKFWSNNTLDERIGGTSRRSKVLHIFPLPVDGECLSDDGRRTGTCFNAYECRQKGGIAKGECAMGFGVCCLFIVNCNETISNNITYLVSPQFPSFMPNNFSSCSIKVKLMSEDISQLRIDFNHFSLGQPNRRTGVCDGDVFNISGGPAGTFSLCGQNSGQHLYYDVGGRSLPRQTLFGSLRPPTLAQLYPNFNRTSGVTDQLIEISMNFAQRFLPIRLWEIRIAQIPFSQRAPAGCLQYHSGAEGFIQTFNFADNGRHLANQHYRVCIRQETEMCSIMYQPCDEQSFRIGPNMPLRTTVGQTTGGSNVGSGGSGGGGAGSGGGGAGSVGGVAASGGAGAGGISGTAPITNAGTMPAAVNTPSMSTIMPAMPSSVAADDAMATAGNSPAAQMSTTLPTTMSTTISAATMRTTATSSSVTTPTSTPMATMDSSVAASTAMSMTPTSAAPTDTTTASTITSTTTPPRTTTTTTTATSLLSDDVEGSGGGDDTPVTPGSSNVSRRPRPVSGGFDLLGFLRSAFDLGLGRRRISRNMQQSTTRLQRQQRQIFSTCSDRITLPCIIEDFIGTGLGPLPSCEPVHCGAQFCSSGVWPCRIESTVTPFFINIHFGDGAGKGSAEDNIGACLRYTQMQCM